jgi:ABC-type Zn uptake system ZnuABC Zn-binding protein ZnuA
MMPTLKHIGILIVAGIAAASLARPVRADDAAPLVLTGTQATYSLTSALVAGTPIRVQNVPPDGRQLGLLKDYIARRMDSLAPTFAEATAVVTLTNALPADPLYRFAREANIRIVDIEAAVPWSIDSPGVALADAPSSNVEWGGDEADTVVAPYCWLSVSNSIRMGDIIAHDLTALFPDSAAAIGANLEELKRSLLDLRGDYQDRLIASRADVVFALTGDFVYLTNDMGLFVDGYFIKQDVRWTETDLAMLTRHLRERDIKIVLHEWVPSEAIQAAVRDGGAKLVVLEAGDPGVVVERALAPDGLQQILRRNLDAIVVAAAE